VAMTIDNPRRNRVRIPLTMVSLPSWSKKRRRPIAKVLLLGCMLWCFGGSFSKAQTGTMKLELPQQAQSSVDLFGVSPLSSKSDIEELGSLVRSQRYPEAETGLRAFLAAHPYAASAHFLLGYVLYREGKAVASLAEYTTGAKFQNPGAADLATVAMDYILLADYHDAEHWLSQAVQWEPGNYQYRYYLGRTQYAENHFMDSIQSFDRCLALRPKDPVTEYNRGLAFAGMGDDEQASAAYRLAIEWDRAAGIQDAQPYLDLGILLLNENKIGEAQANLKTAVEIDAKNPRAHEELGAAYGKEQKFPLAQKELETAIGLAEDVPALHFELGRIYQAEGLTTLARNEFKRFAELRATHESDDQDTPDPVKHD
jgi:Flp pilus assembly protein TadD